MFLDIEGYYTVAGIAIPVNIIYACDVSGRMNEDGDYRFVFNYVTRANMIVESRYLAY